MNGEKKLNCKIVHGGVYVHYIVTRDLSYAYIRRGRKKSNQRTESEMLLR